MIFKTIIEIMRFEVVTAVKVTNRVLWNMTSCSLVERYRHFWRNMLPPLLGFALLNLNKR